MKNLFILLTVSAIFFGCVSAKTQPCSLDGMYDIETYKPLKKADGCDITQKLYDLLTLYYADSTLTAGQANSKAASEWYYWIAANYDWTAWAERQNPPVTNNFSTSIMWSGYGYFNSISIYWRDSKGLILTATKK